MRNLHDINTRPCKCPEAGHYYHCPLSIPTAIVHPVYLKGLKDVSGTFEGNFDDLALEMERLKEIFKQYKATYMSSNNWTWDLHDKEK